LSGGVILLNKYIFTNLNFPYVSHPLIVADQLAGLYDSIPYACRYYRHQDTAEAAFRASEGQADTDGREHFRPSLAAELTA
jgi:hypothetical protein